MPRLRADYVLTPDRCRIAVALLFAAAAMLRLAVVDRPALWADELFTLAVATGHSLEHPAAEADEARGDFVEVRDPAPAADWQRYLRHDDPPAGPLRVIRAVSLSDTNPPLYYLLVYAWTRVVGTSDAALRAFSVGWALASFPLIWAIGRWMGGRRAAVAACWLYAFAPLSVAYSLEGRMYALLWFLASLLAYLSLRLHRHGVTPWVGLLWCGAAAAGLLTHYFFAFVLAAFLLWLVLHPGRAGRPALVGAAAIAGVLVLPWYLGISESAARWRVTAGWLDRPRTGSELLRAPLELLWSQLVGASSRLAPWLKALFAIVGLVVVIRGWLPSLLTPRRRLLWLWLLAPLLGVVAVDVLRGTFTSHVPRYALAGLPATLLVAGVAISRFRPWLAAALLALITVGWAPAIRNIVRETGRAGHPYRELAQIVSGWARQSDLVIVHSIPSGILGVARYAPAETALVGWVGQLGQRRVPEDLCDLLDGRARVAVVRIHPVGAPAVQEQWLRANAPLLGEQRIGRATVSYFDLRPGLPCNIGDTPGRARADRRDMVE